MQELLRRTIFSLSGVLSKIVSCYTDTDVAHFRAFRISGQTMAVDTPRWFAGTAAVRGFHQFLPFQRQRQSQPLYFAGAATRTAAIRWLVS